MIENYDNYIEISKTDCSFEKMYKKEYLSENIIDDIKKANVLLIPDEKYTDYPVFPERTTEFFNYLKTNTNNSDVVFDICIDDDNYKTLEMHDAVILLTTILLKDILLPIIVSLIANYLYDLLKKTGNKYTDVKIDFIVEKNGNYKKLHYDGPIEKFEEVMKGIKKIS